MFNFDYPFWFLALVLLLLANGVFWLKLLKTKVDKPRQRRFINEYPFSGKLNEALQARYPSLSGLQISLVLRALRRFFFVASEAGSWQVAAPSKVVDDAWRQFITLDVEYSRFCKMAFGRYLCHVPTKRITNSSDIDPNFRRTWQIACKLEDIDFRSLSKSPLIFGIDDLLNIPEGFMYKLGSKELTFEKEAPYYYIDGSPLIG